MKTGFTGKDISEMTADDFCLVFPLIKHRLFEVGLLRTAHEFDKGPQQAIGYELAEIRQHGRSKGATTMDKVERIRSGS